MTKKTNYQNVLILRWKEKAPSHFLTLPSQLSDEISDRLLLRYHGARNKRSFSFSNSSSVTSCNKPKC